ncbi:unnamed protein product [Adineta steineri]|uniref:Hexosyltransferase n=1 Tax=Adineta steineri TaxID=433720 RepID=A0A815CX27_9BILA|nr:unnamed protein product [Adineta steineri]
MFRLSMERWFSCQYRYRSTVYIKFILCLVIIYLLNLIIGVQYYLWSERSFENEYRLKMTHIDIRNIDEENPEKILGISTNIIAHEFIIKNEYLCHDGNQTTTNQPHLLILVKSAIENSKARQAIRMTWAKKDFLQTNSIKVAFVVGISKSEKDSPNTNKKTLHVEKESQQYGDIIQIDKLDFYYHNSYKMVMMLRWISEYCSSKSSEYSYNDLRKYVLFIDDDYYLDLNSLLTYINKVDQDSHMTVYERRTFLTGYLYNSSRPRRFLNDRWYISIDDYPYDRYPPYVTAGCFLMTRSNARLFYLASKYIHLFRFDDIYMGLLAYSMSIKLISNNELFSSYGSSIILPDNQPEIFSRLKTFFYNIINSKSAVKPVCIHGYRGEELIDIWNRIHHSNLTLPLLN